MRPLAPALFILLAAAGCAYPRASHVPPPVDAAMTAYAQRTWQSDAADLEHGRVAMLSHCGSCHGMPSVHAEDQDHWPHEIADMVRRAGKTQRPIPADDAAAIQHYILAANATVARQR